jgi:hypothetical protein
VGKILKEFKDQNEKQIKLIDRLKADLGKIKKENELFRNFNKRNKMGSQYASTDMLDKLLDDSEKSFSEQKEQLEQQRGSVDTSKGHDVKTLTMLFGGPEAHQKKLEKSLIEIERELKKGQY